MSKNNSTTNSNAVQVRFNLKQLRKQGLMIVDMHVHTRFSDTYSRVHKLIEKAERMGIGLAVTDHNEIRGVLRAFEIKKKVPVIPGIEISTREGPHILVYFSNIGALRYFYQKYVHPEKNIDPHTNTGLTIPDLMRAAKKYHCVVCAAHPFSPAYTHLMRHVGKGMIDSDFLRQIDAVEALNGALSQKRNEKAISLARELGKGVTGGSDSHSVYELGKIVTCARADSIREFLSAVKHNRCAVFGVPFSPVMRVPSLAKSSRKHLLHLFPSMQKRYEQFMLKALKQHYRDGADNPDILSLKTNINNKSADTAKQKPMRIKTDCKPNSSARRPEKTAAVDPTPKERKK